VPPTATTEPQFPSRFTIERRLGSGGFGVVYAAFDHLRKTRVAIKTLEHADASRLYHLKQEFRSLAGIVHPNLVTLYELISDERQSFLTMELVDGKDLVEHARGSTTVQDTGDVATVSYMLEPDSSVPATAVSPQPVVSLAPVEDYGRLRHVMRQLTEGVTAIHESGQLHRDIKPSNVLVEANGHVKLLDFGMVAQADVIARSGEVGGSPRYMAPEQASGRPCEASDWYSLGVILYECLTGKRLGAGASTSFPAETPADLRQICLDLMKHNPDERPSREELLATFANESVRPRVRKTFIGRTAELAALQECFEATAGGHAVVARLSGLS
jgi:serine/threonine protein kinase